MKKILLSLGMILFVGVVVAGATGAFFSDTETSTGNTFTAGAIDLKIDSEQHYNGNVCEDVANEGYIWVGNSEYPEPGTACTGSWELKDLGGGDVVMDRFFDFDDIKPGDVGENTISIHVLNNDAWVCASVENLTNDDNTQTEPESLVDANLLETGELQSTMLWKVWRDDADTNGAEPGDNIYQDGEEILTQGNPSEGVLALYDSTTGTGALEGDSVAYVGVEWTLPGDSGNETQTDSMTGDITFYVEQSRNNSEFVCESEPEPEPEIIRVDRTQSGFGDGGWAGWSCPVGTIAVGGGIDSSDNPVGGNGIAVSGAPAVDGFSYPVYPHYTFTTDTGYVVHDLVDGLPNNISFHIDCQVLPI